MHNEPCHHDWIQLPWQSLESNKCRLDSGAGLYKYMYMSVAKRCRGTARPVSVPVIKIII